MHAALCTQSPVATSQLSVEHGLPSSHACSMHLSVLAPFFIVLGKLYLYICLHSAHCARLSHDCGSKQRFVCMQEKH